MLEEVGSSFASGTFPGYDDLVAGAFVCAHTWEENQMLLRSPFRRWLRLRTWGVFAGKFDVPAAVLAFHAYVRDGAEFPDVVSKPGEMKALAMPHLARLYLFLRGNGFSETEAMNMPLRVANLLYCAEAEQAGRLELVTDTFKEMVRRGQGQGVTR